MNLKEIRKGKGLTQGDLARMIGRDRSLITKIENAKSLPSVETAKAIAKILSFDWTNFFNNVGEVSSHYSIKEGREGSANKHNA